MAEAWWAPKDIRFTRDQVEWLLSWLPSLKEGNWPAEPRGSGYTDGPSGKRSRSRHASFETPAQIAAEMEARLSRCGLDRYLVEELYTYGADIRDVAKRLGLDVQEIDQKARSVLKYCSGWRRKTYSFREWRGHRRIAV